MSDFLTGTSPIVYSCDHVIQWSVMISTACAAQRTADRVSHQVNLINIHKRTAISIHPCLWCDILQEHLIKPQNDKQKEEKWLCSCLKLRNVPFRPTLVVPHCCPPNVLGFPHVQHCLCAPSKWLMCVWSRFHSLTSQQSISGSVGAGGLGC